jgi:hypothetical protein
MGRNEQRSTHPRTGDGKSPVLFFISLRTIHHPATRLH